MLSLTRGELDGLTAVTAVTVLVLILASAWCAWLQEREIGKLSDDLDVLWEWARAAGGSGDRGPDDDDPPPGPPQLEQEPDTLIAHPADTWSRKQALLARYTHLGQHRS